MQTFLVVFLVLLACNNLDKSERIYIKYQQSGGFAGITRSVEIDSDTLGVDEQKELFQLINEADFFELKVDRLRTDGLPDQYQYTIEIKQGDQIRSMVIDDSSMPDALRPLINYLSRKARSIN